MEGKLKISVFDRSMARPLAGARIQVFDHNNPGKIIEEVYADTSGNTQSIPLPAPPIDYSLEPNQPQPYGLYDIKTVFDGYESAEVKGIQVLSNEESLQDVTLFPSEDESLQTIVIPPSVLYGDYPPKEPEAPVKELPPSTGFVVLPKPVIPEFIVVHAGVPTDASAPNYWVPFKEYIKNVASCEIYCTWPPETLRANILAIISLTLNRVYTEWYRNDGYNFTITSSTRFDQAFTYGRNIFTEISAVVDDIFQNYITKPTIRQPLFTQYCDGKNVQCGGNWMSQWGSKALGDQGYTAINIIKTYYGWDTYLAQAEQVKGVPSSFSGGSLQEGSSGEAVRTIQSQLNEISNNYPAIKKIAVDGVYGQDTKRAVETFQRVFNLPVTGVVNSATWYRISDIFVAVENLAAGV